MNALEVAQCSIDAWNRHDADALVAQYAEGGTYHTPHGPSSDGASHRRFCQIGVDSFSRHVGSLVAGTLEEAWSPPNLNHDNKTGNYRYGNKANTA